jgi:NADH:ubiquinone oxidoreductase subunit 5 (subunit L)/multisubunit Na+/H+ antiporter MnhA subunit
MPAFAFVFMVFTLANVGLPGTSGFIGEFLTLVGAFKANTWVAFLATIGVILSAAYALYLYRRMMFGPLEKRSLKSIADMGYREIAVFAPLVALVILFGFYPAPLLDVTAVSVKKLVSGYETAIKAASAPGFPPPLWGRAREGGIAEHWPPGFPPPLTPPHKGEGDSRSSAAAAVIQSEGSRPCASWWRPTV